MTYGIIAQVSNNFDPASFFSSLGQFAFAVALGWWFLGRGDRREEALRQMYQSQIDALRRQLDEVREDLVEELRKNRDIIYKEKE